MIILLMSLENLVLSNSYRFNFGFIIVSSAFPMKTNARPVIAINKPGGIIHHQNPCAAAP